MKHKFLIFTLFVLTSALGSFGVSYFNNTTERAQAASQKLMGYLWSDNIGWISLSCENMVPCTPGNTYQVTIDLGTGDISGMAWSNNLGWLNFDAGCPAGAVGTCDASMIGNNMEGWARFVSNNPPSWDGWISFSSNSYVGGAPVVSYGPILSGVNITGDAWGSTVVGWINFVDVIIGAASSGLELKPATSASLTGAQVTALPNTLSLANPGTFNLYWYTTDPNVVYTSCAATSSGTSTWVGYTPLGPVAVNPPNNPNQTTPADFVTFTTSPSQTYTLTCQKQGGGFDTATATVTDTANSNIQLRATELSDPLLDVLSAPGAPQNIFVPAGTGGVRLFWWKSQSAPAYTSCTASSVTSPNPNPTTNWNGTAINAATIPELPPNNPNNGTYSFIGTATTYSLSCTDGNVTDTATATVTEGNACNVLNFSWNPQGVCPPGTPGYVAPGISWSTSNALACQGAASNAPYTWLDNPPANTAGFQDVSSYPSGTQFQLSCDGIAGGNCYSSVLTLNYLPANDPSCQQGQQTYQCSDGLDNDNDGFIDFVGSPNAPVGAIPDPGCVSLIDNSEFNLKVKVKEN